MVRDYVEQLYEPTAAGPTRSAPTATSGPRRWPPGSSGLAGPGRRCGSSTVDTDAAPADLGASRGRGRGGPRRTRPATTSRSSCCTARSAPTRSCSRRRSWPWSWWGSTSPAQAVATAKNLHRYSGSFACERAGRYGFTVRVVPSHPDLRTFAELGWWPGLRDDHLTLRGHGPTQSGKWWMQSPPDAVAETVDFAAFGAICANPKYPWLCRTGEAGDNRKLTSTSVRRASRRRIRMASTVGPPVRRQRVDVA